MLRAVVSWKNNKIYITTGHRINLSKWNNPRCAKGSFHGARKVPAAVINNALNDLESKIELLFYNAALNNEELTPDDLRNAINGAEPPRSQKCITAWTQFATDGEIHNQWSYNTIRSVYQVRNLLAKFNPDITFSEINREFIDSFIAFQMNSKLNNADYSNRQKGYSNETIKKNCAVLRWFLRWAFDKGLIKENLADRIHPKIKTTDKKIIFLTWPELMRVYSHPFEPGDTLDRIRDFFCFCCFTSLRFSDALALRKSDVKADCIEVVTKKTSRRLVIDLNDYSREILSKYADTPGEKALPPTDSSSINRYIKRIGRECGIDTPTSTARYYNANLIETTGPKWQFLTSHCARRTFICNALSLGIAPNIVMKWT
ncbi:MAG: site-specific integrase [Candidatus Amulumruptor caecigallinarius]|nr:site-specific integrase [Candidatus Amulumruptor caecigallinarius]